MRNKLLAVVALGLLLLVTREPFYGTAPSTKGLPSQTVRQAAGKNEESPWKKERGGINEQSEVKRIPTNGRNAGAVARGIGRTNTCQEGKRTLRSSLESGKTSQSNVLRTAGQYTKAERSRQSSYVNSRGDNRRSGDNFRLHSLGTFRITGYTIGPESTGKRSGNSDYGITASGTKAMVGRTVAADWEILPPGTVIKIEGVNGFYTVEDTGGGIKGRKLDLLFPTVNAALSWGIQKREVYLVESEWQ